MTKPADETAKARELTQIREWIVKRGDFQQFDPNGAYVIGGWQLMTMLESAIKEAREECARAICHFCRSGDVPKLVKQTGTYLHSDSFEENSVNGSWPFVCSAQVIRALGER